MPAPRAISCCARWSANTRVRLADTSELARSRAARSPKSRRWPSTPRKKSRVVAASVVRASTWPRIAGMSSNPRLVATSEVAAPALRPALAKACSSARNAATATSVRVRAAVISATGAALPATYHDDTTLSFWMARLASSSERSGADTSPYCCWAWSAVKRSLSPAAATTTRARNGTNRTSSSLARKLSLDSTYALRSPCLLATPHSAVSAAIRRALSQEEGKNGTAIVAAIAAEALQTRFRRGRRALRARRRS